MKILTIITLLIHYAVAGMNFDEEAGNVPAYLYEIVDLGKFHDRTLRVVVFTDEKKISRPYLQWLEYNHNVKEFFITSSYKIEEFNFKSESTHYRKTTDNDKLTITLEFTRGTSRRKLKLVIFGENDITQTILKK